MKLTLLILDIKRVLLNMRQHFLDVVYMILVGGGAD